MTRIAWHLALILWKCGLTRLGNHFEDVAICGKGWFGRWQEDA